VRLRFRARLHQESPPFRSPVLGRTRKAPCSCSRLRLVNRLRLPQLKMIRAPHEGDFRADSREVADELRDHQPALRIEPHEDAATMNQQRHPVRLRRKRIDRSDLPLVPIEKIRYTNADRRKDEILETVELLNSSLRQNRTEARRDGNSPLRID